ncbi:MAG: hypothetical protein QG575_801 [Euryarchaeota archaeon]|jgi:hypothetical protein|nr:hypothetical protein [Euryarchaeota archaeon]
MVPSAQGTPAGQRPEDTPTRPLSTHKRKVNKRPPKTAPSSRCGKQHELIVAYTFPGRHPIYENAVCPECGAAIRWLPLGANGNLVPRCSNEKCIAMPERKPRQTAKPVPDVIRARQWQRVGRGRC